ncbi:MAG TPA: S41 family peptidase [Chitinivibrionales bacterium]|jgi:hypothetical protein|nr:S41 family peptidase [Chitinivibrionales bacterium]
MRLRGVIFALAAALLSVSCLCSKNPVAPDGANLLELETVWQYLKTYCIWQDSIPLAPDPFVFDSAEQLLASVNDTFHGYNYTRYKDDTTALPKAALGKIAAGAPARDTTVSILPLTDSTVYLRIWPEFEDSTYSGFVSMVPVLARYPKIIVDLRNNGGGLIDAVDSIIEYFLPSGTPYISAKYRKYDASSRTAQTIGWEQWTTVHDRTPTLAGSQVAVLTNGLTASASEILVAGLKDGRALAGRDTVALVGGTTFGKGIGQIVISRTYLGKRDLKITFLRLDGLSARTRNYHRHGIAPDIRVADALAENTALLLLEPSAKPLAKSLVAAAPQPTRAGAYVVVPADPAIEK